MDCRPFSVNQISHQALAQKMQKKSFLPGWRTENHKARNLATSSVFKECLDRNLISFI
jgi:hypothetical protein